MAFDTVPHTRLLHKLKCYGITGNVYKWVESFLSERKQQVVVAAGKSEWVSVTSGIPQGSVLGPILFVMYINNLPENLKSKTYMFADDTKIYKAIETPDDIKEVEEDLEHLAEWSRKWLLKFNEKMGVPMCW